MTMPLIIHIDVPSKMAPSKQRFAKLDDFKKAIVVATFANDNSDDEFSEAEVLVTMLRAAKPHVTGVKTEIIFFDAIEAETATRVHRDIILVAGVTKSQEEAA